MQNHNTMKDDRNKICIIIVETNTIESLPPFEQNVDSPVLLSLCILITHLSWHPRRALLLLLLLFE